MKNLLKITSLCLLAACTTTKENASFQEIHDRAILVDTHNDILTMTMEKGHVLDKDLEGLTHTDLTRMKKGGLDVQFFSVWSDGSKVNPYNFAIRQIDSLNVIAKRNPDKIAEAFNYKDINSTVSQGKIAVLFGLEGGHMIEDDLGKLENLYNKGVRYMTLTWNNSNSWATSAADETSKPDLTHKGLTDFGKQVVKKMNELGMIVDISHVGEQTFWDVINTTTKPIMASHSSVYNLCPVSRNLKDDQLKAIAKNGGVVQVNFYSGFIDSTYRGKKETFLKVHFSEYDSLLQSGMIDYLAEERLFLKYTSEVQVMRARFSTLMAHIEYIIKLVGVDYVGLGSDFDGIESAPAQLDDVTTYPLITKALLENGHSEADINKILGGNTLRVLKANEAK
jgi:membrane dipeptidase